MKREILYPLICVLIFGFAPSVVAQGSVIEGAEKMYANSLKFRSAGWVDIEEPLYYEVFKSSKRGSGEEEKQYRRLEAYEMEQSAICQTKPGKVVNFYRRKLVGEDYVYSLAGRASTAAPATRYLFLFFPPTEENGTYRIYTIADGQSDSPYGAYQFHNMTGLIVSGMLGKKKLTLSPKSRVQTVKFSYSEKVALPFGLQTKIDGRVKWLARNTYHFNPDKHLKVFIYGTKDVHGRFKARVKGLVDFHEPEEAAATKGGTSAGG